MHHDNPRRSQPSMPRITHYEVWRKRGRDFEVDGKHKSLAEAMKDAGKGCKVMARWSDFTVTSAK